jgi:ABC-2 type transport system permease protein
MSVVRSELLKLRTTNLWWLMGLGVVVTTALALLVNMLQAHFDLHPQLDTASPTANQNEQAQVAAENAHRLADAQSMATLLRVAANVYTSGQFFGVLLVMLVGAMIVTNEFFHQTATATFLTTPHRTTVILGKLVTGIVMATLYWLITTIIDLVAGGIFFSTQGRGNALGEWEVQRSILLNLAAYAAWAVLGIGLGVLIRSQIGAVVTGTLLYLLGTVAGTIVFNLINTYLIKKDWVLSLQVLLPAIASQVMTTVGSAFDHAPPQWVGAVVLIGYGVLFGVIGTLITRKRDIS